MKSSATIRIAAIGDIALNGGYEQMAREGAAENLAMTIAPLLAGSDLAIGNLEGPLTNRPSAGPPWRFSLHGNPTYAPALRAAGVHVVSLANNHMMDHGWEGIAETRGHLEAAGIQFVGVGRNLNEARQPLHVPIRGVRMAFLAYCDVAVASPIYASEHRPGIAPARRSLILEDIAAAKKECDILIVCMHWGQEHVHLPAPKQRRLAREMIVAGANILIGHHPHVLQGVEHIDGGVVAYSLGNFTFSEEDWVGTDQQGTTFSMPYRLNDAARRTAVWKIVIDTRGVIAEESLVPVYLSEDLRPLGDPRRESEEDIVRHRAVLTRRGYALVWSLRMVRSRFHTILLQFQGTDSFGKRLLRLRPRHLRGILRLLAREWEQLRGSE